MDMSVAVEVRDVSHVYADGTRALDGVSFSIEDGERLGLVGPAGAGKSTLALCLAGFVIPEGGLSVCGVKVSRKNLSELRRRLGVIFQDPDDQLFMPTVFDDVAFGLVQRGISGDELSTRVKRALDDRGLAGLENKFPGHLSGGQKRLAALAGVMVMAPEVLILDEPTANLDPRSRRNLINQLASL